MEKKEKTGYLIAVLLALSIISSLFLLFVKKQTVTLSNSIQLKFDTKRDSIAILNINGPIRLNSSSGKMFSYDAEYIVNKLDKFGKQKEIKAVILRINSPGGTVAAVQEIYSEIIKLRKSGKIAVASFGDVAASGGYYIASACDKIVANPGTITGSIGVILEAGNADTLLKKIGIKMEAIKSGKYKDSGSFYREMTKDERDIFQKLVDETYSQFTEAVSKGRNIAMDILLPIADGRIYTGSQALKLGLVDQLGNLKDTIELTKKLANISGEPRLITDTEPIERFLSIFEQATESKSSVAEIISRNKFRIEYMME
jgi:protease-4